ncbi:MAG: tetratricopeptide repeat protein [Pirellulales bacterium]
MQRYRVNYRLLAGLCVGGLVTAGLLYALWSYQISSGATYYLERAGKAEKVGNFRQAFHDILQYTRLHKENMDARVRLANLALDVSKLDDATREERGQAYGILEEAVRKVPDNFDLRRQLVDMLLAGRRYSSAKDQIEILLQSKPDDSELQSLRLQSLVSAGDYKNVKQYAYKLIGYDPKADTFDTSKAKALDRPKAYYLLSNVLLAKDKNPELAERVIDQMVKANPESAEAHLQRSRFYTQWVKAERDLVKIEHDIVKAYGGIEQMVAAKPDSEVARQERDQWMSSLEKDRFKQWLEKKKVAKESIEQALALDATDADVLYQASLLAIDEEAWETARKLLSEGIKQYPERLVFCDKLARVEAFRGNNEEALEILDQGIDQFSGDIRSYLLRQQKINILFSSHDLEGVEREVQSLVDLKEPGLDPIIQFERARMKVDQKQWLAGAQLLKSIVPSMHRFPARQLFASTLLGGCYEQLGQLDLALDTYQGVLAVNPMQVRSLLGKKRILARLKRSDSTASSQFGELVAEELAKPEAEQDWVLFEQKVEKFVEVYKLSEAFSILVRAQVFVQRKRFSEARELVREAYRLDPDNVEIQLSAIRLLKLEPGTGPLQALKLLDRAVKKFGDSPEMRILRVDLFMARADDNVAEQILALTDGIESWSVSDQARLWSTIGLQLQHLGLLEESRRCWAKSAKLVPSNLPARMRIFDLALRQQDDEAMGEAQKGILEIVKNTSDTNYVLTQIKRQIIAYGKKMITLQELEEVRVMLKAALKKRPDWHELVVLDGHLTYLLDKNEAYVLQQFDRALELGPPNLPAIRLQVKLLAKQGRYTEARKKMNLLPAALRGPVLGQLEADILLRVNEPEAAMAVAEKLAASQENRVATQVWFAKLAEQAGENAKAEQALLKAIELNPENPQYWEQLVSFYVRTKQAEKVTHILREAQLQLDDEYLSLLIAKYNELQGRWREAEDIYLSAYASQLDNVRIARRMAGFYLLWSKADAKNQEKAAPLINRILRAVYEGKLPATDSNATWARQQAARMLASTGDYQKAQRALQLLSSASGGSQLTTEDQLLKAKILSARKDPVSTLQAIEQFKSLKALHQLDLGHILEMIKLQSRVGQWDEAKSQLVDAISRYRNNATVWATYVSLLIEHGEFDQAGQHLKRLENLVSKQDTTVVMLNARLAGARGNKAGMRQQLSKLLPSNLKLADDKQLEDIRKVAQNAADMGDQQLAENLLGFYVKRHPESVMLLIQQLAFHGDSSKALELMKEMFKQQPDAVIQMGLLMLQQRRGEVSEQTIEGVSRMIAAAVREDPESIRRTLVEAQLLEFRERYEQSIQAYQKVLSHGDTSSLVRAMAMNNISFLWAILGQQLEEAADYIAQAEEVFGPIADILDTRGVIEIARQRYDAAIEHLQLSLQVDPSESKYFHLAQAHMGAGDSRAAIGAWDQAIELGLSIEKLAPLEREKFQEMAKKIESLRSTSAKL